LFNKESEREGEKGGEREREREMRHFTKNSNISK